MCFMNKRIFLPLMLALCGCLSVSAQQIAVKTNLVMWATSTPNLGVEMALSPHSTISLEANYNPWNNLGGEHGQFKHWLIRPQYRYWFTEKFTRAFIGFHVVGGKYNLGGFRLPFGLYENFKTHHYDGWAVGAGVTIGYHFYISPHWNLETAIGAGYARTKYTRYKLNGRSEYTRTRNYFGPTDFSISFVYLFNSKKK